MIQIGSEHVFEMGGEKAPPSRLVDMKKETSERMVKECCFVEVFVFCLLFLKGWQRMGCFQRFGKMKID